MPQWVTSSNAPIRMNCLFIPTQADCIARMEVESYFFMFMLIYPHNVSAQFPAQENNDLYYIIEYSYSTSLITKGKLSRQVATQ